MVENTLHVSDPIAAGSSVQIQRSGYALEPEIPQLDDEKLDLVIGAFLHEFLLTLAAELDEEKAVVLVLERQVGLVIIVEWLSTWRRF